MVNKQLITEEEQLYDFDETGEYLELSNGWTINIEFVDTDGNFGVDKEYVLSFLNALKDIISNFGIPQLNTIIFSEGDDYKIIRISYHDDQTIYFDLSADC